MAWGWNEVIAQYQQAKQMKSMREQLDMQREALKQEKEKIDMAREEHDLKMDIAFSPIVQATTGEEATAEQIAEARKTGAVTVQREEVTRAAQPERPAPAAVRGGKPAPLTLPATKAETEIVETKKPLIFSFGEEGATIDMTPEKAARLVETAYTHLTPRFVADLAEMFPNDEPDKFFSAIARANSEYRDTIEFIQSTKGQIDPVMYTMKVINSMWSIADKAAGITLFMEDISPKRLQVQTKAFTGAGAMYSQMMVDDDTLDPETKSLVLRAIGDADTSAMYSRIRDDYSTFMNVKLPEIQEARKRLGPLSDTEELQAMLQYFQSIGHPWANVVEMQRALKETNVFFKRLGE